MGQRPRQSVIPSLEGSLRQKRIPLKKYQQASPVIESTPHEVFIALYLPKCNQNRNNSLGLISAKRSYGPSINDVQTVGEGVCGHTLLTGCVKCGERGGRGTNIPKILSKSLMDRPLRRFPTTTRQAAGRSPGTHSLGSDQLEVALRDGRGRSLALPARCKSTWNARNLLYVILKGRARPCRRCRGIEARGVSCPMAITDFHRLKTLIQLLRVRNRVREDH